MSILAHWELKVVAGVLAVALYIYTSGQVRIERTVTVPVAEAPVRGLPGDYQVVEVQPREFKVRLSVPSSRLPEMEADTILPRLELRPDQLAAEQADFPLTSHFLHLSNDIRIEATEPADIRSVHLRLDRITEAILPVDPPHLVGLPNGLVAAVQLDATMVPVRAAGALLDRLRSEHLRIRFQDIPLNAIPADLTGERIERIELAALPAPADMPYEVMRKVFAVVAIRPVLGNRRLLTMPVALLGDRDLLRTVMVEVMPPLVNLTVRGPENLIRALHPEDLTVFVQIKADQLPNTTREIPVQVLAPEGVEFDRPQVRVIQRTMGPAAP